MSWIAKNGLLIMEEYGPSQRMGAVLADMLMNRKANLIDKQCGDRTVCIDRCTMEVLKGPEFRHHPEDRDLVINRVKCGIYETKLIADRSKPEKACGRCGLVCPFSRFNE